MRQFLGGRAGLVLGVEALRARQGCGGEVGDLLAEPNLLRIEGLRPQPSQADRPQRDALGEQRQHHPCRALRLSAPQRGPPLVPLLHVVDQDRGAGP